MYGILKGKEDLYLCGYGIKGTLGDLTQDDLQILYVNNYEYVTYTEPKPAKVAKSESKENE